jgi:hypothetical protein
MCQGDLSCEELGLGPTNLNVFLAQTHAVVKNNEIKSVYQTVALCFYGVHLDPGYDETKHLSHVFDSEMNFFYGQKDSYYY